MSDLQVTVNTVYLITSGQF